MTFCAICTDDDGPFTQRPLGRNGAMVSICSSCDTEPAREKQGPALGVSIPDDARMSCKLMRKQIGTKLGDTSESADDRRRGRSSSREPRPGFIVVRVRRRDRNGKPLDRDKALETLRGNPWFAEVRHLGTDRNYHLFDRPDIDAARAARSGDDRDPLAGIAGFRIDDDRA